MVIDTGTNSEIPEIKKYLKYSAGIKDNNGHGTHITGIIAAKACPGVEIISCYGWSYLNSIDCLERAIRMRIDVINYSMGGKYPDDAEIALIKRLDKNGTVIVAAAGNDNFDIDIVPFYPASYNFSNIIAVGALMSNGSRANFSNYKETMVWELGYKVKSFDKDGSMKELSGTSQAAAVHTSRIVEEWCSKQSL